MHLALLLATLAALLSGPLLYGWAQTRSAVLAFLDGFLFSSIFGLVLFEAVPGTFSAGGWCSALFLIVGLLGPSLFEQGISRARREAHLAALLLAMLGLVAHSLGDGVALSSGGDAHLDIALPLAVAVHSVPVGLLVWRSEEHTSELQSLMRISYAVFCLKKKNQPETTTCIHNSYT